MGGAEPPSRGFNSEMRSSVASGVRHKMPQRDLLGPLTELFRQPLQSAARFLVLTSAATLKDIARVDSTLRYFARIGADHPSAKALILIVSVKRCIRLAIECSECPSRQRRASFTSSSGDHFVLIGFRGMALHVRGQNRKAARLGKAHGLSFSATVSPWQRTVAASLISHPNWTVGKGRSGLANATLGAALYEGENVTAPGPA